MTSNHDIERIRKKPRPAFVRVASEVRAMIEAGHDMSDAYVIHCRGRMSRAQFYRYVRKLNKTSTPAAAPPARAVAPTIQALPTRITENGKKRSYVVSDPFSAEAERLFGALNG